MPKTLTGFLEYLDWFDNEHGSDLTPRDYNHLQGVMCAAADLKIQEDHQLCHNMITT